MNTVIDGEVVSEPVSEPVATTAGPLYYDITLPSRCIPYAFDTVRMRRLRPKDVAKVYRSAVEESFPLLVSALAAAVDQDIRTLTVADFYYIMYWQRLNSYPNSPFEIDWTSRYGTDEKLVLTMDSLTVDFLKADAEEYAGYTAKGLKLPSVADLIFLQNTTVDADERWLYERAQFLTGDSLEEKLRRLDEADMSLLEDIRAFTEATQHGVAETMKTRTRRGKDELLRAATEKLAAGNQSFTAIIEEIKKPNFMPQEESVSIRINALGFFPGI